MRLSGPSAGCGLVDDAGTGIVPVPSILDSKWKTGTERAVVLASTVASIPVAIFSSHATELRRSYMQAVLAVGCRPYWLYWRLLRMRAAAVRAHALFLLVT